MPARSCNLEREAGFWGPIVAVRVGTGVFASVKILAEEIAAIEVIGEQTKSVERGVSRSTAALAGGLAFGVDGAVAGALVGGKQKVRQGTGTLSAVIRTRKGSSYAVDCTLKQAQAISAAIVSPEVAADRARMAETMKASDQAIPTFSERYKARRAMDEERRARMTPAERRRADRRSALIVLALFGIGVVAWFGSASNDSAPPPAAHKAIAHVVATAPVLRGTEATPATPVVTKPVLTANKEASLKAMDAADHCAMTYIGSTSPDAFNSARPAIATQVADCIGYYYDHHHRYPSAQQLKKYTAAQDRDYERHLTPAERRLRSEYAIGEAICRGDRKCVERGVDANQAIDRAEDQMDADN